MSVDDQDDAAKWRETFHQMTPEDAEKWRRMRPRPTPKEGGGIWTTTASVPQVRSNGQVMGTKINNDPVSNPSHYTSGDVECIDAVRAQLSEEGFKGFLHGTVVKYMWRWDKKAITDEGKAEDLRKALWYLNRLYKVQGGK